jgi:hypothetical protein
MGGIFDRISGRLISSAPGLWPFAGIQLTKAQSAEAIADVSLLGFGTGQPKLRRRLDARPAATRLSLGKTAAHAATHRNQAPRHRRREIMNCAFSSRRLTKTRPLAACRDCINSIVHASTGKVRLFAKATGRRNCPKCSTGKIAFTINDLHGISRRYPHASPHFMWISVRPDVSWAAARPLAHPN